MQFEYSPKSFLASIPEMRAFPRLSLLYSTWASVVTAPGNVTIRTSHEVTGIKRRKDVKIRFRQTDGVDNDQQVVGPKEEQEETFDEIILASDAEATLKMLGDDASWLERKVLGNVKVRRIGESWTLASILTLDAGRSTCGTFQSHTRILTTCER